jgi:citrate lyase subunit beta/citryl-CoA lyase
MVMRSLLFVPGDNAARFAGAGRYGADALILDLEDSVAPSRKNAARDITAQSLAASASKRALPLYVRINAVPLPEAWKDVDAIMPQRPDGIVLPKSEPRHLQALDAKLTALEHQHGIVLHSTRVIALATETPRGLFTIGDYGGVTPRLQALSWGGEDLAAELGAVNRGPQGYEDTFRLARSLCVLGAGAAGVDAIDAACMEYRDLSVVEEECRYARRSGFLGKLAIHPAQVAAINAAFTPSAEEVAWARRVVAAFADAPELGVVGIDGKVIDRPHLRLAERLLTRLGADR